MWWRMSEIKDKALAQLAAMNDFYECVNYLRESRDSLERIVRVLVKGASIEDDSIDINCHFVWAARMTPGDFDYLRSLITPEGGE